MRVGAGAGARARETDREREIEREREEGGSGLNDEPKCGGLRRTGTKGGMVILPFLRGKLTVRVFVTYAYSKPPRGETGVFFNLSLFIITVSAIGG